MLPLDEPITDRSPKGVALAIGKLISTGKLPPGQKLPTVRAVAKQLNLSPTTVSDSWRILQGHGAITTDGRRGSFVRGPRQGAAPGRYWQVPVDPGTFAIDLSTGTPDPSLLPPLGPMLQQLTLDLPVTSYLDVPVLPDLEAELRKTWPFEPELLTIVDGAQDGLDRLVQTLVNIGDVVLIDDPAFPPLLDMLDDAGARVIGIPLDDEGMSTSALSAALEHEPVALFLQSGPHNPTGVVLSKKRAEEIAALIADRDLIAVEDDHSGADSTGEPTSVGVHLPAKVISVRSFSKSHGPDLRLAAVGGAASPIDTMVRRRRLGPSWSSRLLQQLLLTMLRDEATIATVSNAHLEYGRRRARFVAALAANGVEVGGVAGLNIWVPVCDEKIALVTLAANGIGVAPGTPFSVSNDTNQDHIRMSIGTLVDGVEELAEKVARAATARPGGSRP